MTSANITRLFEDWADQVPDQAAFVQGSASITYGQLREEVAATAGALQRRGIGQGDAVLVFVRPSPALYRNLLALFTLGARVVFLDRWAGLGRLQACLRIAQPKAILAPLSLRALARLLPGTRRVPLSLSPDETGGVPVKDAVSLEAEAPALVTFTTGTTGIPKAADRTHGFLRAQADVLRTVTPASTKSCCTNLPIIGLLNLAFGKTTVLPPKGWKATQPTAGTALAGSIAAGGVDECILSPAVAESWIVGSTAAQRAAVRHLLVGGGAVYPKSAAAFVQALPRAVCTAVYGSTEAEPIAEIDARALAQTPEELLLRLGLPVGRPHPATHVVILPPGTAAESLPTETHLLQAKLLTGEVGEIVVSGPHVLRHYLHNPEAEAHTKLYYGDTVWHRTGDAGRMDGSGRLYLLGRMGETPLPSQLPQPLYPVIAEYLLAQHAGVAAVAVMLQENRMLIVAEESSRNRGAGLLKAAAHYGLLAAEIHYVRRIPRDSRHHTRIDRGRLQKLLR